MLLNIKCAAILRKDNFGIDEYMRRIKEEYMRRNT